MHANRVDHAIRRRYSLRTSLLWLVAVCILPAVSVSVSLAIAHYRLLRDQIHHGTVMLAHQVAAELDRELAGIESGLRVLATSSDLTSGNLDGFHKDASDALTSQVVQNYVLVDRQGRQVLNTLRPPGAPLPVSGTPTAIVRIFDTGAPALSDLFIGPVAAEPLVALGVPVYRGNDIAYALAMGMKPAVVGAIVDRQTPPAGWTIAVLDGAGNIVAANGSPGGGQSRPALREAIAAATEGSLEVRADDGTAIITSFSRSSAWPWSVAVGVPRSVLEHRLFWVIFRVGFGALAALGLGLWLASGIVRRVTTSVRDLNNAALAMAKGEPVVLPGVQFAEADAVGAAILEASRAMATVQQQAYHDPLTGLANRALFEEAFARQLALSERTDSPFAVLAIDLDEFKGVNDQQGHAAGDAVLRMAAERITGTVRASDVPARMGGDEFSVLLVDTNREEAIQTAERLVTALSQPYPGVTAAVSASVGIAIYHSADKPEDLLDAADRALYRAKGAGKKRAVLGVEPD
jgi:diguanylate cyclase (GGDEF)-like protein